MDSPSTTQNVPGSTRRAFPSRQGRRSKSLHAPDPPAEPPLEFPTPPGSRHPSACGPREFPWAELISGWPCCCACSSSRTPPESASRPFAPLRSRAAHSSRADCCARPSNLGFCTSATQNNRCRMCGAPTPAAHRSAAPTAYPSPSRSLRTPASHARPSLLATCSPKTIAGRHSAISPRKAGHKCRASRTPPALPALLNGWQGQLPVQTASSSGHPARRRA